MDTVPDVTVVHLALKSYGLEPFRAFLESYRRHPAGHQHALIVALKGFADEADAAPFIALLGDVPHRAIFVADAGLDIGTYREIARTVESKAFCFFNSRARILADDWLAKMISAAQRPGVGLVSATGSRQSLSSDHLRWQYRRTGFPAWTVFRQYIVYGIRLYSFPPFPNSHVRTNAFLIRRELFLAVRLRAVRDKRAAMAFESGWNGLTRQLAKAGYHAVIVDRGGNSFTLDEADAREAFWQGEQSSLLAADNQTDLYDRSETSRQRLLTELAWHPPVSRKPTDGTASATAFRNAAPGSSG